MQTSSMADRLKQVADRITFASMNYRIWRIYTEPGDRAQVSWSSAKVQLVLSHQHSSAFRRHDYHALRSL